MRVIRLFIKGVGLVVLLAAALFIAGYVATMGDHGVPRTVTEDPALPRIEVNGTVLHAQTFGDPGGPVVVVVHGGPGADHRALLSLRDLADDFRVVFYDQRGSGLSARVPPGELTLETFLADLDAVVERFGQGRPVDMIGHSWGGGLAAIYLARHPDKIGRLVLAEPVPLTPEMQAAADITYGPRFDPGLVLPGLWFWLKSLHVDAPDGHARSDYFITRMAPRANPGHHCNGAMAEPDSAMWRFGVEASRGILASLTEPDGTLRDDLLAGLGEDPRDILFLAGACSQIVGPAFQRRQMALFPGGELVVLENSGHMMFTDQPVASVTAVRTFLGRSR